ncbi:MAG: helix-turn-helix domain-containing protein [Clostridia bacterium]|nr:helix-turn-helix domain-containing protein [Clostridia bacterium]
MKKVFDEHTDALFEAILCLKTKEECEMFFQDICTIKEIQDLSQRYEVARLLADGCPYQEIARLTGASTATISRVNKAMQYGEGGYQIALGRRER